MTLPSPGITFKADTLVVAEKAAGDAAEMKTETPEVQPPPPDASTRNGLFTAAKNLNDYLTTLQAALPPRTALLLFSGQQRSAFDVNTRCSQGGVPGDSARKTEQLYLCGRWGHYGALEHGGRSGARGGGREGPNGVVVRWSQDVGAM